MIYEHLYAAHHGEVRAFARRLLRDEAEADDVTAQTFEVLPHALERFQHESDVRSFMFGICANLARRVSRSSSRRRAAMERLADEVAPACDEDPETIIARREIAAQIAEALEDLPDEQRTAFILTSIEERSAAEVAAICGVPEATVRTRLFHARRKLREALRRAAPVYQRMLATAGAVVLAMCVASTAWAAVANFPAIRTWVRRAVGAERRTVPLPPPSQGPHGPTSHHRAEPGHAPAVPTVLAALALPADEAEAPAAAPALDATPHRVVDGAYAANEPATAHPTLGAPTTAHAPEEPLALYARAHRLHFRTQQYAAALRAWDVYLATLPRGRFAIEARYNRAITLVRLSRFAEARRALAPFAAGVHDGYRRQDAATLIAALDRSNH